MNQNLETIKNQYQVKIADLKTDKELESLRIELFGRNGLFNDLFTKLKEIPVDERRNYGQELNVTKNELEKLIAIQSQKVQKTEIKKTNNLRSNIYDLPKLGHLHPITQTERQ